MRWTQIRVGAAADPASGARFCDAEEGSDGFADSGSGNGGAFRARLAPPGV